MENHHFQWVNPLFLWPFSIAMLVITRGYPLQMNSCDITLLYRACAKHNRSKSASSQDSPQLTDGDEKIGLQIPKRQVAGETV